MTGKSDWGLGQWQGYVTQGKDRDERRSRLAEAPISIRQDVERHVQTVFDIKKYHKSVMGNK